MALNLVSKFQNLKNLDWRYIAVRTISNMLFLGAAVYAVSAFWEVGKQEVLYSYRSFRGIEFTVDEPAADPDAEEDDTSLSPFAQLLAKPTPLKVEPVSEDFGLIIERIGINAPVIEDVSMANKAEYLAALEHGVAHAKYTAKPGRVGNTYIFAHSALDFWNYGPYGAVFNLLRKLEPGDRIVIFYRGERYDYEVEGKEVVSGFDISPLLRTYTTPHLTLQTCDPPGVALNRLIVTAELKE
jgi:LPXTG-site transpeptidase (sortase) family protein